jgi:hypothetical protein
MKVGICAVTAVGAARGPRRRTATEYDFGSNLSIAREIVFRAPKLGSLLDRILDAMLASNMKA